MGLGRFRGGADCAKFAFDCGASVTVTDIADAQTLGEAVEQLKDYSGIEYHLAGHREDDFRDSDIVIVNPAVPPDNKYAAIAAGAGALVASQIEIFFQLCKAKIVGITGSNGKSTTTALTAKLLSGGIGQDGIGYKNVYLGGNIGNEPLLTRLGEIGPDDIAVLELSSFQLEQLARIKTSPAIAVVTNVTPNHLDRHGTFEAYCQAKENIFKFQRPGESLSIFNGQDPVSIKWFNRYKTDDHRRCELFKSSNVSEHLRNVFKLPGEMNLANLAAALSVAKHFGVNDERIVKAVAEFTSLPHRLELIADSRGVRWYSDSISTTPVSTIAAINAFDEGKVLIAGGYDKALSFDELGASIARKVKGLVLIGQTAKAIAEAVNTHNPTALPVEMASSMSEAVICAEKLAEAGDVVLLSPACASYDMFDNFQHRGQAFKGRVLALKK